MAAAPLRHIARKCIEQQRGNLVEINVIFNLTINYVSITIASQQRQDAIG